MSRRCSLAWPCQANRSTQQATTTGNHESRVLTVAGLEPLPVERVQGGITAKDVRRIPHHGVPATREEDPGLLDVLSGVAVGYGSGNVVGDCAGEPARRIAVEK